jgi:protein O-GlcNAc transferase
VLRAAELISQGRGAQAEPLLRRRVQSAPGDLEANRLLAIALLHAGKPAQAEFFARRAAESNTAPALDALGTVLVAAGKPEEAVEVFTRAVAAQPAWPGFHNGLGGALLNCRRYDEAAAAYGRARELDPTNVVYWRQESAALGRGWRLTEALLRLREGVARFPDDLTLRTQLVSVLNYVEASPARIRAEHVPLGRLFDRTGSVAPTFTVSRERDRPLRVGLVSADWYEHPVAHFVSPLFEHPHPGMQLFVYDSSPRHDAVTDRLRARATRWRSIAGIADHSVAEQMRRDGIDVGIDLGGHTLESRVGILAHHGAPVQVSYLGYPATTGMRAIGWRLVDSATDPPGAEQWCSEHLIRLDPSFLCFLPPAGAPEPGPLPSRERGCVTFGSFNNPAKLSAHTIALWSRVLAAVPGSMLVLKGVGLEIASIRKRIADAFADAGLERSRIRFLTTTPSTREHLAAYHAIDIALDPFPYHGTTTTCEALWMGVPVVTLAGEAHASRVGVSILQGIACAEWIAHSPEDYVRIAAGLARDEARRAALRPSLRDRILRAPLGDAEGFVARFERAIRSAWECWASQ